MAELSIANLRKRYGNLEVIKGVDLEVEKGEFVVFVGPSGCGKSTLLRMIAGLESITDGELKIDNEFCNDVHPGDRGIAMVFQSYALYPHMTVYDNIGFNLRIAGFSKAARDEKIRNAAKILKIENLLRRKPSQLSGGQRQRVAIGRAIVREPHVFLFDEPLSNLDAALRVEMRAELAELHRRLGATMIYVTHDQVEAMTLADRIVVLEGGVVQQIGRPIDLYKRPSNLFVAGFIGSPKMNFLAVEVLAVRKGFLRVSGASVREVEIPADERGVSVGDKLTFGIRPHDLEVSGSPLISGVVQLSERLGGETVLNCITNDGEKLLAVLDEDREITFDAKVQFSFNPNAAILFDRDSRSLLPVSVPLST